MTRVLLTTGKSHSIYRIFELVKSIEEDLQQIISLLRSLLPRLMWHHHHHHAYLMKMDQSISLELSVMMFLIICRKDNSSEKSCWSALLLLLLNHSASQEIGPILGRKKNATKKLRRTFARAKK